MLTPRIRYFCSKSTCHHGFNSSIVCVQEPSIYLDLLDPSTALADAPPADSLDWLVGLLFAASKDN